MSVALKGSNKNWNILIYVGLCFIWTWDAWEMLQQSSFPQRSNNVQRRWVIISEKLKWHVKLILSQWEDEIKDIAIWIFNMFADYDDLRFEFL